MSEIARLREQIELACESAQRGLTGYAAVASHEFITARLEHLGQQLAEYEQALVPLVGQQEAVTMVAASYVKVMG